MICAADSILDLPSLFSAVPPSIQVAVCAVGGIVSLHSLYSVHPSFVQLTVCAIGGIVSLHGLNSTHPSFIQVTVCAVGGILGLYSPGGGHYLRRAAQPVSLLHRSSPHSQPSVHHRAPHLPLPVLPLPVRLLCHLQARPLQLLFACTWVRLSHFYLLVPEVTFSLFHTLDPG